MTHEEELAAAEKDVKSWELTVRFHSKSPPSLLRKASEELQAAIERRDRILYKVQEEKAHNELSFLPWLGEDHL